MFQKSFTSLVFSPKKIQVFKLNQKKGIVEKYCTVALPDGVIIDHQVKQKEILVDAVKKAWIQINSKDKSVGIIIPEFSTYTKTLFLPKLKPSELNEAVHWQSQEFLPARVEDMVIDWQIIKEEKDKYQIMVSAVHKFVLAGYVNVASEAGLLPIVVETPSLSLVRLVKADNSPKLVIYVNHNETTVVVAQGESILASSVVASVSQKEIIDTAVRITNHYQGVKIEKVLIGGVGLAQEFLNGLQTSLGIPIELLTAKIGGLTPQQIQEYLIPYSLQLKDPAEPESTTTVNLLPPVWVKHYRQALFNFRIWTLSLAGSIVVWSSFLIVLASYMLLSVQDKNITKQTIKPTNLLASEVSDQVQNVNNLTKKVMGISEVLYSPQGLINTVSKTSHSGIAISNYSVNTESGKMIIAGTARDRTALFNFKKQLENQEEFLSVEIPISNILTESNTNFEITITL